jgi:outer membrane protein OmpA-like peptidoglycan-associated protein
MGRAFLYNLHMAYLDVSKEWVILVEPDSPVSKKAALDLARCIGLLAKSSGLPARNHSIPLNAPGAGISKILPVITLSNDGGGPEQNGFSWRAEPDRVEISGESGRGLCNGVYDFLASLGFIWPGPGQEKAPSPVAGKNGTLTLSNDRAHKPSGGEPRPIRASAEGSEGGRGTIPATIPWNGANERNSIQEGRFTPALTVNYTKGDVVNVSAPPVTVDISGPILGFRSSPEYFSPDNDGVEDELFIYLSARDASPIAGWSLEIRETEGTKQLFYRISGRGSPSERIIWDGKSNWGELVQGATDYEYTYRASDILGNSSSATGKITSDVLVIRDGDILRIQVPSITFRADHADFLNIPQERQDTNIRVLKRIAEILNKFRDYKITVEGHANPVKGTPAEEINELRPLSLARAQVVIDLLAGYGVTRSRLSPIGRGGGRTVANPRDQNNNWKNRRVEFLLIK